MAGFHYIGGELELFAAATVWKAYFRRHIDPYLKGDVLEVGAGLGGTTKLLCRPGDGAESWVCLEPDASLAQNLEQAIARGELPGRCKVTVGTLDQVQPDLEFDTVLYIDVLEHIDDDRGELTRAATHLKPGGRLVVLGPAHAWLFSPFDAAIGHYRRYTRSSLRELTPDGLVIVRSVYLDAAGLLASLGNRLILRHSQPNPTQIAFWDKILVRCSRLVDPLVGYSIGKSVVSIWERPAVAAAHATEVSASSPGVLQSGPSGAEARLGSSRVERL